MVESITTQGPVVPEPVITKEPNATTEPNTNPEPIQTETPSPDPKPDLVSRVSQVAPTEEPKPTDTETFNPNDIENIQDPQAKDFATKAYKSLEKGYQVKFQELATQRKEFEAQSTSNWTPEKVRSLTQDPEFVTAAQNIVQAQNAGLSEEEYSALTDTEKKQFSTMQQQLNQISQQNTQLRVQQEDEGLKGKYSNYDSSTVNNAVQSLLANKVSNTREMIWKAIDYENGIKRAYSLGLEDRKLETNDKTNSISIEGNTNIQPSSEPLKRNEGESAVEYFKRLAHDRLVKTKQQ